MDPMQMSPCFIFLLKPSRTSFCNNDIPQRKAIELRENTASCGTSEYQELGTQNLSKTPNDIL